MINQERLLQTLFDYIRINSETKNEYQMAKRLEDDLTSIGCSVSFDNAGETLGCNTGNLYAVLPGDTAFEPILLTAHMDTVSPGANIEPQLQDGVLSSKGNTILGGDDKQGCATIVEVLRTIVERNLPHPTIEILCTIHEEGGVRGSAQVDYSRLHAKKAAVLDSSGAPGKMILTAPGQCKIQAEIIGKSAHAGVSPENGISAIQVASHAISQMHLLRIDEETTANIGSIHSSYATNIVPERLTFIAEARSRTQEKLDAQVSHMIACLEKSCETFGASCHYEIEKSYSAYAISPENSWVQEIAKACDDCGLSPVLAASGGGSDANHLNLHGITAIPLGTGMTKVHTIDETLLLEHVYQFGELVLTLVTL